MKAVLQLCTSLDVDDLDAYVPANANSFTFGLTMSIGPDGYADGRADLFHANVSTPNWLADHMEATEVVLGEKTIWVLEYDWPRIRAAIQSYLEAVCHGDDWLEIARKVSQIADWEFEGESRSTPP
jgi:hypothetical protein